METKMNRDANESAFFTRELEKIKAHTYDTIYKDNRAMLLLPVESDTPSGYNQITWRSFSNTGVAKVLSGYTAKDYPRVDVYGTENTVKIKVLGDSFGYNDREIKQSAITGVRLDARRAQAARECIDNLVNDLALTGDSTHNIQGFINYPGMSEYIVPNGAGLSPLWINKTPDEIVADLTGIVNGVMTPTNNKEIPDTIILPIEQFNILNDTRMTDGNDKTILTYFLSNNKFIKTIEWLTELKGAGAGGTDRMICYKKDANKVALQLPVPFEQMPPQRDGMENVIFCNAECAGVIMYYPLSACFADGI